MDWLRVRVRAEAADVPGGPGLEALTDAVAAVFLLCGFGGVAVSGAEVTGYAPATADGHGQVAELARRVPAVAAALAPGARVEVMVDELPDADWSEAWKRHWQPEVFGARLWVVPSWHDDFRPPEGALVLRLDPGMAFGTGDHLSTRLSLLLLEQALRRHPAAASGPRVLDAGTGSGILALAAARLGAARVLAVDVDETAVAVARDNAARNGLLERVEPLRADAGTLAAQLPPGSFQVIVANILAEVLIPMAPALARLLAPAGDLILSGIIAPQRARVLEAYAAAGLRPRGGLRVGDWCGLWLGGGGRP